MDSNNPFLRKQSFQFDKKKLPLMNAEEKDKSDAEKKEKNQRNSSDTIL